MKKVFLVIVASVLHLSLPLACYSQQQHKIDSLTNVLKTEKEDTNKVKTLALLSQGLFKSNHEQSYEYATEQLQLAQKLNFKHYIIEAYRGIAGYYYYKGDIKTAIDYIQKTIPVIEQTNDKSELGHAYSNLSSLAHANSNFPEAIDYSNRALEIGKQLKDSVLIALVYGNMATIYTSISDYPKALNYLFLSNRISEDRNDKLALSINYCNIGNVYLLMGGNSQKALSYAELSLKIAQERSDKFQMARSLQEIGEIYRSENDLNKALDYFQQSLSANQLLGSRWNVASSMCDIGLIYIELGQFDKANSTLIIALSISQDAEDKKGETIEYGYLGELYMKKKDYKSAVNYLSKSVKISREIGQKNNERIGLKDLSTCYEKLGNYKLAYDNIIQHSDLNDSILNENSINKTKEIEAKYDFDKKEKEIVLLTKDKALLTKNKEIQNLEIKKQTFLRNSLILGSLLSFVLFFLLYRNYRSVQLLKLQKLRIKIASDLHDDIGSTLSSISVFSLIARQQSKETIPMLEQIGEYSRKMLDSMADIVWSINPENDNFEEIIERMRLFAYEMMRAKNIVYKFSVDESVAHIKLPMEIRKDLYLIFKEATNNLVKYSEADSALFSITRSKNHLEMLIRDKGKGFDIKNIHTQGNGLKNMKARAENMGAEILIESEPGKGTTIQLLIKAA